jgi:glycosyltransferase involved in cell wall biosynthesis
VSRSISLSAVLPVFNEEKALPETIRRLSSVLKRETTSSEIIVVDDGSTDATPRILKKLILKYPKLKVITHEQNRGYGRALRSGFAAARYPWVLLMDADGQFNPEDLPKLIDKTDESDFVIGIRVSRHDALPRRLLGRLWTLLGRLFLGVVVADANCGFKLLKKQFLPSDLNAEGAAITLEFLSKGVRLGASIAEVPVAHWPRRAGRQTGAHPKVILKALLELWWLRKEIRQLPRSFSNPTVKHE